MTAIPFKLCQCTKDNPMPVPYQPSEVFIYWIHPAIDVIETFFPPNETEEYVKVRCQHCGNTQWKRKLDLEDNDEQ